MHATEARLLEMEAEVAALAQAEEFDRADAISGQLAALRAEVDATAQSVCDMRQAAAAVLVKLGAEKRQQRAELAALLVALARLSAEEEKRQGRAGGAAEAQRRAQAERLDKEEERLALEAKHLARDQEALAEEVATTEAAIATQLGGVSEARDALQSQCRALDAEVAALEAALAAKRDEARAAHAELSAAEGAIGDVRRRYDRQLQRIADRRAALDGTSAECEAEAAAMRAERQRLAAEAAAAEAEEQRAAAWRRGLGAELAVGALLGAALDQAPGWRDGASTGAVGGAEADPSLQASVDPALRLAVSEAAQALAQAQAEAGEMQAVLDLLGAEARELEDRAPKVEAEKKAHAAARRFKEAAASAKEHKDLCARLDEVSAAASDTRARVATRAGQVEVAKQRLAQSQAALDGALALAREERFAALLARATEVKRGVLGVALEPEGGSEAGLAVKRAAVLLLEAELEVRLVVFAFSLSLFLSFSNSLSFLNLLVLTLPLLLPSSTSPLLSFLADRVGRGTGPQAGLGPRLFRPRRRRIGPGLWLGVWLRLRLRVCTYACVCVCVCACCRCGHIGRSGVCL